MDTSNEGTILLVVRHPIVRTEILRDRVECPVIVAKIGETMDPETELFADEFVDVGKDPFTILTCSGIKRNDACLEVVPIRGCCSFGD